MSAGFGSVAPQSKGSPGRLVGQVLISAAIALLAYQAVYFWLDAPLHYIADHTPESFGEYWPKRWWLLPHIAGGTIALFLGPFQFWSGLRARNPAFHRLLGRLYVIGIAVGGGSGFYLSFHTTPVDFGVALFWLSFAWWLTVGMAVLAIRRRRFEAHREWMIRGYVVTFAFVAFRYLVELPVMDPLGAARASTVLWLSFVPALLVTEGILQWRRTVGTRSGGQ